MEAAVPFQVGTHRWSQLAVLQGLGAAGGVEGESLLSCVVLRVVGLSSSLTVNVLGGRVKVLRVFPTSRHYLNG